MAGSKPRFTIEVTERQKKIFEDHVPHGLKKVLLGSMVEDCCFMLENFGKNFISAVLLKEVNFRSQYFHGVDTRLTSEIDRRPQYPGKVNTDPRDEGAEETN